MLFTIFRMSDTSHAAALTISTLAAEAVEVSSHFPFMRLYARG
jgi:hypothetical protein